ncbi:MAG: hypothetical protein O7D86_06465 [Proteobacteria bacterium]|nr:hypothetical protein [Pseudomonadota bacterium]
MLSLTGYRGILTIWGNLFDLPHRKDKEYAGQFRLHRANGLHWSVLNHHIEKSMKANEIDKANNPLIKLALPALQRAAKNAREQAIIHNTLLILWRNNRIVKLSPTEMREQASDNRTE